MPGINLPKIGPPEKSTSGKPVSPLLQDWTDQDFREAFESLKIPNETFHHREHIRLAWIYSRQYPQEQGLALMVQDPRATPTDERRPSLWLVRG